MGGKTLICCISHKIHTPKRSLFIFFSNGFENFDVIVSSLGHAVQDVGKECHEAQLPLVALV